MKKVMLLSAPIPKFTNFSFDCRCTGVGGANSEEAEITSYITCYDGVPPFSVRVHLELLDPVYGSEANQRFTVGELNRSYYGRGYYGGWFNDTIRATAYVTDSLGRTLSKTITFVA